MGGVIAEDLKKEGYELTGSLEAALPMAVWAADMEVERLRLVSAAELAILKLIESGVSEVGQLARLMGMGTDQRLAERVLVKLLGAGAVEADGEGFGLTSTGQAWKAEGSSTARERVTFEVRLDPARDCLEWVDSERPIFATQETWTIELPPVSDEVLLGRRAELGELVRTEGLPDDEDKAVRERRPSVELRSVAIRSSRLHWRAVGLDIYKHTLRADVRIVGHIGDAENPPLTQLLARHGMKEGRRRVVLRG